MQVEQFRYSADNFSYVIHNRTSAVAVDAGAVNEILSYIESEGLSLRYITNTHNHMDHTPGNKDILRKSKAEFLDNKTLRNNSEINIDDSSIRIFHTPGHTEDSITFHAGNTIITGDTLFNGTVGNCFSGDLKGFYESIKMLLDLSDDTVVYAGHDYVRESMAFAKHLEPDNLHIDRFLKTYDPYHVRSTLEEEKKINPYIRFNDVNIISILKKRGLPVGTEYERWKSMMSLG